MQQCDQIGRFLTAFVTNFHAQSAKIFGDFMDNLKDITFELKTESSLSIYPVLKMCFLKKNLLKNCGKLFHAMKLLQFKRF